MLDGYEVARFLHAVETGELPLTLDMPIANNVEKAWKRYCAHKGVPCRVREGTEDEWWTTD
jgi:hypothetical protein